MSGLAGYEFEPAGRPGRRITLGLPCPVDITPGVPRCVAIVREGDKGLHTTYRADADTSAPEFIAGLNAAADEAFAVLDERSR